MNCLLVYDIPSDKKRTKIADTCLDYGLERIQYSAFLGDLSHNQREELLQKLKRVLGKAPGKIHLFPICQKDMKLVKSIIREKSGQPAES